MTREPLQGSAGHSWDTVWWHGVHSWAWPSDVCCSMLVIATLTHRLNSFYFQGHLPHVECGDLARPTCMIL